MLGVLGLAGLAGATRRLSLRRVVVVGPSMIPTLDDGERLLARRVASLRCGDLAVFSDPDGSGSLLVKRVVRLEPDGFEVRGDNEAVSVDSRAFGTVEYGALVGVAVYRYAPADQAGILARGPR